MGIDAGPRVGPREKALHPEPHEPRALFVRS